MQFSKRSGVNILAGDIRMLRKAFRAEGFLTPDVYAEAISRICGGAFGAEELQAEQDELASRYLANPRDRFARMAKGPLEALYNEALGKSGMPEKYHNIIETKRLKERELIPLSYGAIEKVSHIRQFAEKLGERNGYTLDIRASGLERRVAKTFQNGLISYFSVDTGGRRGALWSSTNMSFEISIDGGQTTLPLLLFRIVRGLVCYTSAAPSSERIISEANPRASEMLLVSDLLKVGVLGQIRFLDLLSACLDRKLS